MAAYKRQLLLLLQLLVLLLTVFSIVDRGWNISSRSDYNSDEMGSTPYHYAFDSQYDFNDARINNVVQQQIDQTAADRAGSRRRRRVSKKCYKTAGLWKTCECRAYQCPYACTNKQLDCTDRKRNRGPNECGRECLAARILLIAAAVLQFLALLLTLCHCVVKSEPGRALLLLLFVSWISNTTGGLIFGSTFWDLWHQPFIAAGPGFACSLLAILLGFVLWVWLWLHCSELDEERDEDSGHNDEGFWGKCFSWALNRDDDYSSKSHHKSHESYHHDESYNKRGESYIHQPAAEPYHHQPHADTYIQPVAHGDVEQSLSGYIADQ